MANFELNVKVNGIEQTVSTIGQLEQALAATNQQLTQVEENSKEFNFLSNQAKNLETVLTAVTQDANKFNKSLGDVSKTTKEINSTFTNTAQAATQMGASLESSITQSTQTAQSLRTELRNIIQELQGLEPGSARFQALSIRAGELRDQMADTNSVVNSLAGNTTERLGTALTGVVNIGVMGLQGVVGGMQLFGVESEKAKAILEKLQGLLFLTQAIQGFGGLSDAITQITAGFNSLFAARSADLAAQEASTAADASEAATTTINVAAQAASTAGTEAHTAAVIADATATEGATVATTGFTAALAANPIGLVVVGLTALISALIIFGGEEKKAASNIKETTDAMLEQANMMKDQENSFFDLYKARKEIEILQEKDAAKRLEMERELAEEILGLQQESLEKQADNLISANSKLLEEFDKYKQAYIGERRELVNEVAQYDEYGIFIGNLQEFQTVKFNIGQKELNDLKNKLATERAAISADIAAKRITQEEGRIKEEQAETRFYIDYLTKQKEFLKQSNKASDEALAKNLDNLLSSFQKVRSALEKNLAEQVRIQQEAERKQLEEQQRAAEQAQRERQAALDRQRDQYKRAYDDIKNSVKQRLDELNAIEQKFTDDLTRSKFTTKLEEVEFEKKKEQEKIDAIVAFRKKEVQDSKVLGKEKQKLITQLETETKQAQDALETFYFEKRKKIIEEEVKLKIEQSRKLSQINEILQKEITFGDQSTADSFEALNLREQELTLKAADFDAQQNKNKIKAYTDYLDTRLEEQIKILTLQRDLEIKQIDAENTKRLQNFEDLLTKEFGLTEVYRQRRYKGERDALDKSLADGEIGIETYLQNVGNLNLKYNQEKYSKEKEELKKQLADNLISEADFIKRNEELDKKANDTTKSDSAALYQTGVNNAREAKVKEKEINEKFRQEEKNADTKTQDDIQKYRLSKLDEYVQAFAQITGVITGLFQAILDAQNAAEDARIQKIKESNQAQEKLLTEQYNKNIESLKTQYEQGLISQEIYTQKSEQLELSRNEKINDLNNTLNDETIKGQKDLFKKEQNLKISQAIISGLQGAAQAFAGAFSLGPIAGPIVGAALAALVLATTGAQVKAIRAVKFDETGLSTNQPPEAANISLPNTGGTSVASTSLTGGGFTSFTEGATGAPTTTGPTFTPFTGGSQKVYVLESDITATQRRVQVLENNSTFG